MHYCEKVLSVKIINKAERSTDIKDFMKPVIFAPGRAGNRNETLHGSSEWKVKKAGERDGNEQKKVRQRDEQQRDEKWDDESVKGADGKGICDGHQADSQQIIWWSRSRVSSPHVLMFKAHPKPAYVICVG